MAVFEFSLPTDAPLFTMRVTLSGEEFVLRFDYSGKEDRWYFSLLELNENPIRRGIKVTPEVDLLRTVRWDTRAPARMLAFWDRRTPALSPGLQAFGRTTSLLYLETLEDVGG